MDQRGLIPVSRLPLESFVEIRLMGQLLAGSFPEGFVPLNKVS
jgi:hypothetical protein